MLDKFSCAVPSEQNCTWGHHDIVTPAFGKLRRVAMVSLSLSLLLRLRSFGFWGFWMAKYGKILSVSGATPTNGF